MKAIPYRLHLLEPVLVSQAETGEENGAIALPFIPGSAIRGAVVARYLEEHPTDDLAAAARARQWFLDGAVCYLNAYPWYAAERVRMLPTPRSWFTEKDQASDEHSFLYDWAVDPEHRLDQPKSPQDAKFCHLSGTVPGSDEDSQTIAAAESDERRAVLYNPPRQVNVHIGLVETNRRDESNQVFRYDALAAGEILAGAVVAPDNIDLADLHALLCAAPELLIGRAQSAGYGRVRLEVDEIVPNWHEYPSADPPDSEIIVTLLSDTLVRGRDGQINGDLDGALAGLLGLEQLEAKPRYQSAGLVGGFNRKWGLPLQQGWALEAGSVYVYKAGAFNPDELRRKAAVGLGERCAEGFGRIAVNWHTAPRVQRQPRVNPAVLRPRLSVESKGLAQEMAQRRLRQQLERGLTAYLSQVEFKRLPPNTQLARVRSAVQRALTEASVAPVKEHLQNLKGARDQLARARVGSTPLLDWIDARIEALDVQVQLLSGGALPEIAGERATLDDDLKRTYTLRLIDGVMQKASK